MSDSTKNHSPAMAAMLEGRPPSRYETFQQVIDKHLKEGGLTSEDILNLTIASRLNGMSDHSFAQAMSESSGTPARRARRFGL